MRIRTFFHITKGRGGQGQHKFKSNYSRDQRFLTETRLCYKYLQQKKTQIMIQTVGLRHFSETTVSVHFLILGGWLDQLHVCKPHYWILFLLFASLVNFSNAQVIRGGPEFSVKKILFYCVIQDALFFHLAVFFYCKDSHNSVTASIYLLKKVSEHKRYLKNVKYWQITFRF